MRAEERHRLKTNELAQKLSELPVYLRKHSKLISIAAAVLVVLCVVGGFWWNSRTQAYHRRNEQLQGIFPQINQIQIMAANAAQDPGSDDKSVASGEYNTLGLLGTLNSLSSEAKGTSLGMAALMQQADLKRSELYYINRRLSAQEREKICRDAENLYNQILNRYGKYPLAVGMAKMGLALLAEDRGDWTKAKITYEEILAQKDDKLAGTMFPFQAKRRLSMIDDIALEIEFPYIEPEPQEPEMSQITVMDKEKVDPLKSIEPIKIDLPKAPAPQVKIDDKPIGSVREETETEKTTQIPKQPEPKSAGEKPAVKHEKKEN